MPLQATSGAASYDGFGGGAAAVPQYIEDVFSTYLYTGNATARSITNNIDLSTKGGLVWTKSRSLSLSDNFFVDTARGATKYLISNGAGGQVTGSDITAFNADGYSLNNDVNGGFNNNGATFASWTFRKQPKFFDVVTYTGNGTAGRTVAHNLGSVPGVIIVKRINAADPWRVYHRSLGNTQHINLDTAEAASTGSPYWNSTTPTSTVFSLGSNADVNGSGSTYVAYIFAHDAGGFGLTGTDNVISCGSYTGIAYPNSLEVTIGFEPQFVIIKNSNTASDWTMWDIMRGMAVIPAANDAQAQILHPNTSAAESIQPGIFPTATGFVVKNGLTAISSPSDTMVYIAIRRGPMKVPTTGTSVYKSSLLAGNSSTQQITDLDFPPDLVMTKARNTTYGNRWTDRLRGFGYALRSDDVGAQLDNTTIGVNPFNMNGFTLLGGNPYNSSGNNYVNHAFRRAPSFFDEVCYTGTVSATTFNHNLGAVPELMIVKRRTSGTGDFWFVYSASTGNTIYLSLNTTSAVEIFSGIWNDTTPTSTQFTIGYYISQSAAPYVAYLFATCAGVSKVGSYTGTGTTLQVNCGFTGGARFVLIKRTDSTGDWYVWDSARGIVAGNDPYLLLNSTAAEVTNTDYVDTYSAGFEISSTAPAAINANGGSFIFFAVA